MRLYSWLAYLLATLLVSFPALACENEIIRIAHGGPQGSLIRYRLQIGGFILNGVISEGAADQIQCLSNGDIVTVTVTEVNGQPVNFPASGSPKTATGTAGEVLNFSVSASPPQVNWQLDTKTSNQSLFDQVYQVLVDGQVVYTSPPIKPGDSFEFHYSDPNKKPVQLVRYTVTPDGERVNPEYSRTIGTSDPNWYQDGSTSPGFNSGTDTPVGVPIANTGQGKIPYADNTTEPAKEDSLRKIGDALYDATAQAGRNTVNELRGVHGKLSAVENELKSGFLNVNGNLVSVKSAVEAINTGVGGIHSRLDALNNTATQTKGVIENQFARIISMDAKFDTANGYLLNLRDGQQSVLAKLGNIDSDLDGVAKETTLAATKSTIQSEGTQTRDSLGTLHTTLTQAKDAIGVGNQINQEGHLGTKTSVDQVKSVLASVYAAIEGARTEANASASALQGKLDTANQHLSNIKDSLAGLNFNSLGPNLDNIAAKVQANTDSTGEKLDEVIDLLDHSEHEPAFGGQQSGGTTAGSEMKGQLEGIANSLGVPSIPSSPASAWKVTL